jgi:hypothetical protein
MGDDAETRCDDPRNDEGRPIGAPSLLEWTL